MSGRGVASGPREGFVPESVMWRLPSRVCVSAALPVIATTWLLVLTASSAIAQTPRRMLDLWTSPAGATITVDGSVVGRTPTVISVPVGRRQLVVEREGFARVERTLDLEPGPRMPIRLELARLGSSTVTVRFPRGVPSGLRVSVDGTALPDSDVVRTNSLIRVEVRPGRRIMELRSNGAAGWLEIEVPTEAARLTHELGEFVAGEAPRVRAEAANPAAAIAIPNETSETTSREAALGPLAASDPRRIACPDGFVNAERPVSGCVCPAGMAFDRASRQCVQGNVSCPTNLLLIRDAEGERCSCRIDETVDPTTGECIAAHCYGGTYWSLQHKRCACPNGSEWSHRLSRCVFASCGGGTTYNPHADICECAEGENFASRRRECVSCGLRAEFRLSTESCECVGGAVISGRGECECPVHTPDWRDGVCSACYANTIWTGGSCECPSDIPNWVARYQVCGSRELMARAEAEAAEEQAIREEEERARHEREMLEEEMRAERERIARLEREIEEQEQAARAAARRAERQALVGAVLSGLQQGAQQISQTIIETRRQQMQLRQQIEAARQQQERQRVELQRRVVEQQRAASRMEEQRRQLERQQQDLLRAQAQRQEALRLAEAQRQAELDRQVEQAAQSQPASWSVSTYGQNAPAASRGRPAWCDMPLGAPRGVDMDVLSTHMERYAQMLEHELVRTRGQGMRFASAEFVEFARQVKRDPSATPG